MTPPAAGPRGTSEPGPTATDLRHEILLVLAVSVAASALFAALSLLRRLTADVPLSQSQATLNSSYAPGRPWLDLAYQLAVVATGVVPALLALHLLRRSGVTAAAVGADLRRPRGDLMWGALLAAAIGLPGLLLYLTAHRLGLSATIVAQSLPEVWWRYPVLVLSAAMNSVLEEVVEVAYLLTRLSQLGWRPGRAIAASAVLRGSYHLYQGFGAFVGNAVMGVVFGWFFHRTRRVAPLVVAHTLIDVIAFVGYALLRDRVGWLP